MTYSVATGTSFAAPHVAGIAAIFLGGAQTLDLLLRSHVPSSNAAL